MENYKMGICDSDIHYIVRLMEYINARDDIPIRVAAFSSEKAVEEYMSGHSLDILLMGETMSLPQKNVLLLTITEEKDGQADIYKYQSIEKIAQQVLAKIREKISLKRKQGGFFGVYSPLGRCGKTRLALEICQYFGESLYVNMEEYPGVKGKDCGTLINDSEKTEGLEEDFFYYLFSRNMEIRQVAQKLPRLTKKNGEDAVRLLVPAFGYPDLCGLQKEDAEWLKKILLEEGVFRSVVFDIGTGMLRDLTVLEAMDRVYVPTLADRDSQAKLACFRRLMERKEYRRIRERLSFVPVSGETGMERRLPEMIESEGF